MAVEKIVIEVSGKDDLSSSIKDVEKLGAADAANAAIFKKTNQEFQAGLKNTNKAVNSTVESLKSLVPAISAAFAVQSVVAFGKASLNAFIEAERGEKLLLNALGKNEAAFKRLTASAKKYQETTVYDDDTIIAAQSFLATQGRTEEQINKVIRAATNLSAVTGESLQSSVEKLDATYEGSIGRLGKMDSRFKSLTQAQLENGAAIDLVAEKYKGFAEAELETTAGKLQKLQNAWGEVQEKAGAAIYDMAVRIKDNTLTGGLIDQLLFGQSQDLQDELLKIKLVQGAMADLNADMGEFEDARANQAAKQIERKKADEVQVRNIAFLKAEIKRLSDELEKNGKSVDQNKSDYAALVAVQNELNAILGKTTDKIKEQKKAIEESLPTEMLENMAEGERQAAQKRIDDAKKTTKAIEDNEAELMKHIDKLHKTQDQKDKDASDERVRIAEEEADKKKRIEEAILDAAMQITSMYFDAVARQNQADTDNVLNQLQTQLDAREITQEQYNESRKRVLTQQANDNKANSIFEATIKGAVAVVEALGEGGPVLAAIAAALVLAEIATIAAAPVPQFEKGGRIKGKRHREGGTVIEAEDGEFVINRKAAKKIGFDNLEVLNRGALPPKLLKQGLTEQRNKVFETSMMKVFGSADFDTYPIEKELRKSRKNDTQIAQMLIKQLGRTKQKRGY